MSVFSRHDRLCARHDRRQNDKCQSVARSNKRDFGANCAPNLSRRALTNIESRMERISGAVDYSAR